ncbi:hypothetical protein D1007_40029 [Hordeum vulgare]|nr:hypothetical protein D1007_40029 [Hordeum vulgare]
MTQGPWLFRNMAVIFAPYDGYSEATYVPMVHMPIWLQIHKLSDGYCRADVVEKLLRSLGKIVETRIAGNSRGDYIRVRVKHDVRRPLTKFVSIVKGKVRTVYAVRYEKLARFCKACGIIGHDHKECGNGVHEERDLKFGDYLYADPPGKFKAESEPARSDKIASNPPTPKVSVSKGVSSLDKELEDTTSSPFKKSLPLAMEVDKSARKRLLAEHDEAADLAGSGMVLRTTGEVIFAAYRKLFHCNDALEAEIHDVLEGIKLTTEHSDATIMIHPDCAAAINALTDTSLDNSTYSHMIKEIKFLLSDRVFIPVKVSHDQNRVADYLANYGRCGDSTACWLGHSPPFASDLVAKDCNSVILE